jgi:hypothetical protein
LQGHNVGVGIPTAAFNILETELREVADRVERSESQITAGRMRGASLGAINRTDSIFIARANGHQVLLIARLDYRTSFRFWGWLSFLVFTAFGWIIPIVAYFYQMRMAQSAFEELIRRLKLECEFRLPKQPCPQNQYPAVAYFYTATASRSRALLWPIFALTLSFLRKLHTNIIP